MAGKRPTDEEQDRMARDLGADSLMYLPQEEIARAIGMSEESLCRACVTGEYPTPTGERLYQLALKETGSLSGRTYEKAVSTPSEVKTTDRDTVEPVTMMDIIP